MFDPGCTDKVQLLNHLLTNYISNLKNIIEDNKKNILTSGSKSLELIALISSIISFAYWYAKVSYLENHKMYNVQGAESEV